MARALCSSAPLSGAAPFHEANLRVTVYPSWGPSSLSLRAKRLPAVLARPKSWWGGGLNSVTISQKCWSPLVEPANTTTSNNPAKNFCYGDLNVVRRRSSSFVVLW